MSALRKLRQEDHKVQGQTGLYSDTLSPKKMPTGILIGVVFNLEINLGRTDILIKLSHSIHEYGISFHLLRYSLYSVSMFRM
jgi:hypothetical protein